MALIRCPECGRENISDNALACPDCGFDIRGWKNRLDEQQKEREKAERAEENLRFKREQEEEERQRILNSIPDPLMYGKIPVYIVLAAGGLLFFIFGGGFWIAAALIAAGAYFAVSYLDYKKFLKDPLAYKKEKAAKKAGRTASSIRQDISRSPEVIRPVSASRAPANGRLFCPACGSEDVSVQVFQENNGSQTFSRTTSKYNEKRHGCLWWLLIGWWWWIIDLLLWIFAFFPRLILKLFASGYKKKKHKGSSNSVSKTVNEISYRRICTCRNCGNTWS